MLYYRPYTLVVVAQRSQQDNLLIYSFQSMRIYSFQKTRITTLKKNQYPHEVGLFFLDKHSVSMNVYWS